MKNLKKRLAILIAALMMLSSVTVFAADTSSGTIDSTGDYEGWLDMNVFSITLPAVTEFKFTIDPQGLLAYADADKYNSVSAGDSAVWFKNAGDTVSTTSDALTIVNRSSFDIDTDLSVTLTTTGISFVSEGDLEAATAPALSLKLTVSGGDQTSVSGGDEDYITAASYKTEAATLNGIDDSYEVHAYTDDTQAPSGVKLTAKSPNGYYYSYELGDDYSDADNTSVVSYMLTGACNNVDGWSKINITSAVTAKVVWSCAKHSSFKVTGTSYSVSSTANTFTVEWDNSVAEADKVITSIAVGGDGVVFGSVFPVNSYSLSGNTLTINATKGPIGSGGVGQKRYIKITVKDGSSVIIPVVPTK